jgi:hypothetical protein
MIDLPQVSSRNPPMSSNSCTVFEGILPLCSALPLLLPQSPTYTPQSLASSSQSLASTPQPVASPPHSVNSLWIYV